MERALPAIAAPATPARVTGPTATWVRDGVLVGAATGYIGPALVLFGFTLHPWLIACTATCAVGGGVLGVMLPALLERVRGRLSLPALAVLVPLLGVHAGLWCAAAAAWVVGAPMTVAATYGAVAAGTQLGLFWLPYTVLAVLGLSRWPVVVGAIGATAALGWLAEAVFVVLVRLQFVWLGVY